MEKGLHAVEDLCDKEANEVSEIKKVKNRVQTHLELVKPKFMTHINDDSSLTYSVVDDSSN